MLPAGFSRARCRPATLSKGAPSAPRAADYNQGKNEPGKGKDPWGGGNRNSGSGSGGGDGGGPPDLDQIWKRFRERFGNKRGGGNGGSGGSNGGGGIGGGVFLALIPIVFVIWLATGLYVVQPGEKGVVLRLGELVLHDRLEAWEGLVGHLHLLENQERNLITPLSPVQLFEFLPLYLLPSSEQPERRVDSSRKHDCPRPPLHSFPRPPWAKNSSGGTRDPGNEGPRPNLQQGNTNLC